MPASPKVSVIVIAYSMSRQLENTLYSLTAECQNGVSEDDYEVIVMENDGSFEFTSGTTMSLPSDYCHRFHPTAAT